MAIANAIRSLGATAAAGVGAPEKDQLSRRLAIAFLLAVLGAAILYRLYLFLTTSFPLNDGGFFIPFIRESAASFPVLARSGAYNGMEVPFAYPPLAFWFGGLLMQLGVDPVEQLRVLPILFNIVFLLLLTLLLLRSGRSLLFTALTLLFLSTRLQSFMWVVMGGGFTRGLGTIFLLLALLVMLPAVESRTPPSSRRMIAAGAATAGAILSHPEWGILTTASVVTAAALCSGSIVRFIRNCFIAGLTALLLILPWLVAVYSVHGADPFFAAGQTSYWEAGKLVERLVTLARTMIMNPFMLLGAVILVWRREPFWLLLLLLAVVLTPRGGSTAVALTLSVLAAAGALAGFGLLQQIIRNRVAAAAMIGLAVIALNGVRLYRDYPDYAGMARELTPAQRSAMSWVAANHPRRTYAVVTPENWGYDRAAEWFPALTGATSVTTVQGSEWLPGRLFAKREEMAQTMKAQKSCKGLLEALARFGPVEFVWAELGRPCFRAAGYTPLYTRGEVTIFEAPRR